MIWASPIVAEGIQSQEDVDRLGALACDFGQGFFIGEPMTAKQVVDVLSGVPFGAARNKTAIDTLWERMAGTSNVRVPQPVPVRVEEPKSEPLPAPPAAEARASAPVAETRPAAPAAGTRPATPAVETRPVPATETRPAAAGQERQACDRHAGAFDAAQLRAAEGCAAAGAGKPAPAGARARIRRDERSRDLRTVSHGPAASAGYGAHGTAFRRTAKGGRDRRAGRR